MATRKVIDLTQDRVQERDEPKPERGQCEAAPAARRGRKRKHTDTPDPSDDTQPPHEKRLRGIVPYCSPAKVIMRNTSYDTWTDWVNKNKQGHVISLVACGAPGSIPAWPLPICRGKCRKPIPIDEPRFVHGRVLINNGAWWDKQYCVRCISQKTKGVWYMQQDLVHGQYAIPPLMLGASEEAQALFEARIQEGKLAVREYSKKPRIRWVRRKK